MGPPIFLFWQERISDGGSKTVVFGSILQLMP